MPDAQEVRMSVAPWFLFGNVMPHLHMDIGAYQFYKVAPPGMMFVVTHWHLEAYSRDAVLAGLDDLRAGIDVLAERGVDVISIGGVPVSAVLTRPRVLEMIDEVEQRTGIRCSSTFESYVSAMRHLGVDKVAFASRWSPELNQAVIDYLAHADIDVVIVRHQGRDLEQNKLASPAADRELLGELGRQAIADAPQAQGLMIPGGLGFVVHTASVLERELGIPTFTNSPATIWEALHGYGAPLPHRPPAGWAQLLDTL